MKRRSPNWEVLVKERNEWVAHNFPNHVINPPGESIIGCIEELGELAHADLKHRQGIRGTAKEHIADAKDAIGDLSVFLMGVMAHCGIPYSTPINSRSNSAYDALVRLSNAVGELSMAPSQTRIANVIYWMREYCRVREWDYAAIVTDTWNEVKQRDWVKYPKDGLTHEGESLEKKKSDEEHDEAADASPA